MPDRLRGAAPLIAIVGAGLGLRLVFAYLVFPGAGYPSDLGLFSTWATTLGASGPGSFYASAATADYPPGYLYLLWLIGSIGRVVGEVTGLPPGDVAAALLKTPAILADTAIAIVLYAAGRRWFGPSVGLIAATLYLFVPVTWFDSALWGQIDAVGTLVLIVAVVLLIEGWSEPAVALTVLAVLIKPQYAIALGVVLPVLVRRHLIAVGSGPVPTLGGRLARLDAGLGGLLRRQGPIRLATSALIGSVALLVPLLPFDIAQFATPSLADVPGIGHVAGLMGLFAQVGGEFSVVTANAYNAWALVGDHPLASVIGSSGAAWTSDSVVVIAGLPAVFVGGVLLVAVGAVIAGGLLRRDGRTPILLAATILALAFYLLPTRVHERYLFPFFALGALLAASSLRVGIAYVGVGLLNAVNLHAVLAGAVNIRKPGGGFEGGRGGLGGGGGVGGFGPGGAVGFGGGGPGSDRFVSIDLPFADLARNELVVAAVAIGQTAVLVGLLAWWVSIIVRPDRHAATVEAGSSSLRLGSGARTMR